MRRAGGVGGHDEAVPPASVAALELYPAIRAVGPPDAPFEGTLVRAPDGRVLLCVDATHQAEAGWGLPVDPHVLAPEDVVRRADGHDLLFTPTPLRLDRLLARRMAAGTPLHDGEIVTVAVSALRGTVAVAGTPAAGSRASWWVTAEGRPVLVAGAGEDGPLTLLRDLLLALGASASPALTEALTAAADHGAQWPGLLAHAAEDEDRLFAAAEPEPLAVAVLELAGHAPHTAHDAEAFAAAADAAPPLPWWRPLARAADRDLAEVASELWERMRRIGRSRRAGKGRAILWGGAVAAGVLAIGLAWPQGGGAETVALPSASPGDGAVPARDMTPTASGAPVAELPAPALAGLLDARAACPDDACRGALQEDPATVLSAGALASDGRTVTLLDDFGGLAVLRVDAPGATAQFVTIVATNDGWRIRDAYDAADPPSG